MTIYISLPITGFDLKERKRVAHSAKRLLLTEYPEAEVVTPFDVADYVEAMNPKAQYADYMAEDIGFMLKAADMICFLVNPRFTKSKGVKLEWHAARIYHKKIKRMRNYEHQD